MYRTEGVTVKETAFDLLRAGKYQLGNIMKKKPWIEAVVVLLKS